MPGLARSSSVCRGSIRTLASAEAAPGREAWASDRQRSPAQVAEIMSDGFTGRFLQGAQLCGKHKSARYDGFTNPLSIDIFRPSTCECGKDWDIPILIANLQRAQVFDDIKSLGKISTKVSMTIETASHSRNHLHAFHGIHARTHNSFWSVFTEPKCSLRFVFQTGDDSAKASTGKKDSSSLGLGSTRAPSRIHWLFAAVVEHPVCLMRSAGGNAA